MSAPQEVFTNTSILISQRSCDPDSGLSLVISPLSWPLIGWCQQLRGARSAFPGDAHNSSDLRPSAAFPNLWVNISKFLIPPLFTNFWHRRSNTSGGNLSYWFCLMESLELQLLTNKRSKLGPILTLLTFAYYVEFRQGDVNWLSSRNSGFKIWHLLIIWTFLSKTTSGQLIYKQ